MWPSQARTAPGERRRKGAWSPHVLSEWSLHQVHEREVPMSMGTGECVKGRGTGQWWSG